MKLTDRMRAAGVHGAPYTIAQIVAWAEAELDRLDSGGLNAHGWRNAFTEDGAARGDARPQDFADSAAAGERIMAEMVAEDKEAAHSMPHMQDDCSEIIPPVRKPGVLERLRNGRWL